MLSAAIYYWSRTMKIIKKYALAFVFLAAIPLAFGCPKTRVNSDTPEHIGAAENDNWTEISAKRDLENEIDIKLDDKFPIGEDENKKVYIRILAYHHVIDDNSPLIEDKRYKPYRTKKGDFRKQLEFLKENYKIVSTFEEGLTFSDSEECVMLTFDDGWENVYQNAFPLLKEFGIKGVFFIITDRLGKDGYMTEEQVKEMAEAGMNIGSHSCKHLDYNLCEIEKLKLDLRESREKLSAITGKDIKYFCYPGGAYRQESKVETVKAGYTAAFAYRFDLGKPGFDREAIPRIAIYESDADDVFKDKINDDLGRLEITKTSLGIRTP